MVSIQSDILVFNSKNKSSGTNINANYNLLAMGGIGASPSSTYEMLSYHSVDHMYNVEVGVNDKVYFDEGAGLLTGTLNPGAYTTEALMLTEIVRALDAAGGVTYGGSSFDVATGLYSFVPNAGTFGFLFASNTTASARRLLGKNAVDDVQADPIPSDVVVDLRLHSNIFIKIPQDGNKHVTLLDGTEYSLMVPLNNMFGEEIHHRKQQHYQQFLTFVTNISAMDIELYTQDGVALVNAPDYELILRKVF